MMKIWFRVKEWFMWFCSAARNGYLFIYQLGIFCIIAWTIASLLITYRSIFFNPLEALTVRDLTPLNNGWFSSLMFSIVSSDANRIFGKGLLMLLVWIILFLLLPLVTGSLKRFKLFNLEFEMERPDRSGIANQNYQNEKVEVLSNLYSKASKSNLFKFYNKQSGIADFGSALSFFLQEITAGYRKNYNIGIAWEVYEWETLPKEWERPAKISAELNEPFIENQESKLTFKKKHILVYTFSYFDKHYVTVLSSYTSPFDLIDKYSLVVLHHAIAEQLENIEYVFWIDKLQNYERYKEVAYE